jgi:cellobiose phosphorylase
MPHQPQRNPAPGRFSDDGRRFIIDRPDTPTPWVNVICNGRDQEGYGLVVSQSGGGFSWMGNSQLNVLTRWEMDLVQDRHGKFLYLRDTDTNEVWSLAPAPCRSVYDAYRCVHGPGASVFETERAGIRARWTLTVSPSDPVEIWRIELENVSGRDRSLRVASYLEWCCGVAPDSKREFHKLFITTRHDPKRRAILATKNMWDLPPRNESEHWNRPWPFVAAHAVNLEPGARFDRDIAIGDKTVFLGRNGDPRDPAALRAPPAAGAGVGRFADGVASLGGDFTLPAGKAVRLSYLLACGHDDKRVLSLLDRYADLRIVDEAIEGAEKAWEDRLAPTRISTDRPDFDLLNNTWLPYQAISGRLWGRTGYYQQSGAFGFRDQLQDSQVWLPLDPARTAEQILLHAGHQFADGSVYHWWHPALGESSKAAKQQSSKSDFNSGDHGRDACATDREVGLRTACSDDYLWLPFVTAAYIRETADTSILDEVAPFVDDKRPTSLLDHCKRSVARAFSRLSPRGLPLIGSCDWNDGLSAMGVEGRGESVWLAFFLADVLEQFAHVLRLTGGKDDVTARDWLAARDRLIRAANLHAWDGAWFRRATSDDGNWIGSAANDAGRIYLNPQTWAILTRGSTTERLADAWASVKEHLVRDMGPLLLAPAYSVPDPAIGYITRYAPGSRENGGVYMHAATWALAAACAMNDRDAASRIWESISPPARSARDPERYAAEPYVTPGNVDGPDSATPGRAGWTWYTGSAGWLNRVSLEWVLGVRPTWEGLLIRPCPPASLGRVEARRRWRGVDVVVRFDATAWSAGEPRLTVNGVAIAGATLRSEDIVGLKEVVVEVDWGVQTRPVLGQVGAPGRAAS